MGPLTVRLVPAHTLWSTTHVNFMTPSGPSQVPTITRFDSVTLDTDTLWSGRTMLGTLFVTMAGLTTSQMMMSFVNSFTVSMLSVVMDTTLLSHHSPTQPSSRHRTTFQFGMKSTALVMKQVSRIALTLL